MELRRVTTKEFKQAVQDKSDLSKLLAVKGFAASVAKAEGDDDDRILTFTISTQDVDRDDDSISQDGWELDNFLKGGSVLWAHDAKTPAVAKPLATWIESSALKSRAQFTPKEMNPFAYMVYEMYRDGYMRGASVGFLPKEWKEATDRGGWMPLNFTRQELLEWSTTPVPSNPNALREAKSAGLDLNPMVEWAERFLDGETPAGLAVSREAAETLRKAAKGDDDPIIDIPTKQKDAKPPVGGGDDVGDGDSSQSSDDEPGDVVTADTASTLKAMQAQLDSVCDDIAQRSSSLASDLKALLDIMGKSGRVLSAANESRLRDARDLLQQVLEQVEGMDEPDDDDKSVDDGVPIELAFDGDQADFRQEPEQTIELDTDSLGEMLSEMIGSHVDSAIRRAQGRID